MTRIDLDEFERQIDENIIKHGLKGASYIALLRSSAKAILKEMKLLREVADKADMLHLRDWKNDIITISEEDFMALAKALDNLATEVQKRD